MINATIPNTKTGRRAVAFLSVEVLVEIDETDSYYDMVQQAEDKVRKHITAGTGFFPFREQTTMIQEGTVAEMLRKITIQPNTEWNRK